MLNLKMSGGSSKNWDVISYSVFADDTGLDWFSFLADDDVVLFCFGSLPTQ